MTLTKKVISTQHVAFNERRFPLKRKREVAEIDDEYAKEKVCGKEVSRIKSIPEQRNKIISLNEEERAALDEEVQQNSRDVNSSQIE